MTQPTNGAVGIAPLVNAPPGTTAPAGTHVLPTIPSAPGQAAFASLTADLTYPADDTVQVTAEITDASLFAVGMYCFIDPLGHFSVLGSDPVADTLILLPFPLAPGNAAPGTIAPAGTAVLAVTVTEPYPPVWAYLAASFTMPAVQTVGTASITPVEVALSI